MRPTKASPTTLPCSAGGVALTAGAHSPAIAQAAKASDANPGGIGGKRSVAHRVMMIPPRGAALHPLHPGIGYCESPPAKARRRKADREPAPEPQKSEGRTPLASSTEKKVRLRSSSNGAARLEVSMSSTCGASGISTGHAGRPAPLGSPVLMKLTQ